MIFGLFCPGSAHPLGLERSTGRVQPFPAPGAEHATGAGVPDPAGGTRGPLHWRQTAGLAIPVALGTGGGGGVRHYRWLGAFHLQ